MQEPRKGLQGLFMAEDEVAKEVQGEAIRLTGRSSLCCP